MSPTFWITYIDKLFCENKLIAGCFVISVECEKTWSWECSLVCFEMPLVFNGKAWSDAWLVSWDSFLRSRFMHWIVEVNQLLQKILCKLCIVTLRPMLCTCMVLWMYKQATTTTNSTQERIWTRIVWNQICESWQLVEPLQEWIVMMPLIMTASGLDLCSNVFNSPLLSIICTFVLMYGSSGL